MIVYGDPVFTIKANAAGRAVARLLGEEAIDARRDLLITCGQIEQALSDSGEDSAAAAKATDAAAELFLGVSGPDERILGNWPTSELRIKVPEGYAFYGLSPEQYVRASDAWIAAVNPGVQAPILVVGVRSIGTSLSAIVRARLRSSGLNARRITVRPTGHPFARTVTLPALSESFSHAIVADEGPGLSGSSMAAVVSALRNHGLRSIAIFPSHAGEPGSAAADGVRQLWATTPKFVFPVHEELGEQFRAISEELLHSPVRNVTDLSAGHWRSHVPGGNNYPATPAFERTKFLVRAENGRALLWKFAGHGCGRGLERFVTTALTRQQQLAESGWTLPPRAVTKGFIATEWLDAPRAPITPFTLARYVVEAAQPITVAASESLLEMLLCNVSEGLGASYAECAERLVESAGVLPPMPAYGDGRLAPHEWLSSNGRSFKTDVWGHDFDHTCIGVQPILWDIAGALQEWSMTPKGRQTFLDQLRRADLCFSDAQVQLFEAAYCSFRLGIATMFGDENERERQAARLRELLTFSDNNSRCNPSPSAKCYTSPPASSSPGEPSSATPAECLLRRG